MRIIERLEQAREITTKPVAALYFSAPDCRVCDALRPRIEQLFEHRFPRAELGWLDLARLPQASGTYQVFTVPTLIGYFDGREGPRFSRSFGLGELEAAIQRPYAIFFGESSEAD